MTGMTKAEKNEYKAHVEGLDAGSLLNEFTTKTLDVVVCTDTDEKVRMREQIAIMRQELYQRMFNV